MGPRKRPTTETAMAFSINDGMSQIVTSKLYGDAGIRRLTPLTNKPPNSLPDRQDCVEEESSALSKLQRAVSQRAITCRPTELPFY